MVHFKKGAWVLQFPWKMIPLLVLDDSTDNNFGWLDDFLLDVCPMCQGGFTDKKYISRYIKIYSERSVRFILQIQYFSFKLLTSQVLTPVNNSLLLLKLEILYKSRMLHFIKHNTKKVRHYNWLIPVQEKWEFSWPWLTEHWSKDTGHLGLPFSQYY